MGKLRFKFAICLILLSLLVSAIPVNPAAQALSGNEFQAGRIMDDGVFFDTGGIDIQQIQAFLNAKVPVCDTNGQTTIYDSTYGDTVTRAVYSQRRGVSAPFSCLKDARHDTVAKPAETNLCNGYGVANHSSAEVIYHVAQSCGVSAKVLIVLLQKEQSLVTDDWPWPVQYQKATGYGCPDTAPCDSQYYGFFNQVYSAARQFKRYARDANLFNYRANTTSFVAYNPNAGCGGSNVLIQNQATAGLYNYTPYQPNAAALNNLYSSGDSCSAYGNRNFWRLYSDWFGGTFGPIRLVDDPASVSWEDGRIDILGRGADSALWQKTYDASLGGWQPWLRVGGVIDSAPAVTTWGNGRLDVFSTSSSGELMHVWYGAGAWQNWESLGKPAANVKLVSPPGAVSWGDGRIDIFGRGSDGVLWQMWYDTRAGGWQSWVRIGGVLNSAPTVSSWAPDRLDLFSAGPAGDLQHLWYDNGWKSWESLGFPAPGLKLTSAPGAVSWGDGRIDVFVKEGTGVLWQEWFDGNTGGWKPWFRMGGPPRSAPSVSSWQQGRLDIFARGPSGDLIHYWHGTTGWSNYWESLGYPAN